MSKTPEDLRRMAADLQAQADAAQRAGKTDEWERLQRRAWMAADMAEEREKVLAGRRLPGRDQRGNTKPMVSAARVRISKGADDEPDELVARANAAGYTLRSLAEAVKCSHSLLSQARRGERSIRRQLVVAVEKLTGFKATAANWPGGIRD